MIKRIGFWMAFLTLTIGGNQALGADPAGEFFRGKTLTWISVSTPGSSTDLVTRIITPLLAKEIGVRIIIENRGEDEGFNYIYNKGTRDGLTLGIKSTDAVIGNEILKAPGVQYDTDKLNFVSDVFPSYCKVFQVSPKLPYKTVDSLRKAVGLRGGGTTARGTIALSNAVALEILGLDGKVITGFKGRKELDLSMARGELDFMVVSDNMAMKVEQDGYVVNLFVVNDKKSVLVPHLPTLSELGVRIPRDLQAAHKFVISGGAAVVLPPGVPPERVDYLRKAFQSLDTNKDLHQAIAKATGSSVGFIPGKELQQKMIEIKADKELAAKLDAMSKKYSAVH